MGAPEWIKSDVHSELKKAVDYAEGREESVASMTDEVGVQEEISGEDVKSILKNVNKSQLKATAHNMAEDFHSQDEIPKASSSLNGEQTAVADGGDGFFQGRSGRIYYVTVALINTVIATNYAQSSKTYATVFSSLVIILCLALYLKEEEGVEIRIR
jgi:hypothetical protein